MKKIELLSPAGNMKMLKMAIHNGADAVYLAGKNFGARKFSDNFNNEEIKSAIEYAHLYGVKVYITVNTLVKDDEIDKFIDFIEYIHKNNVDAILMQDLGMISLIRQMFPNLEIHASTQFHNHNEEGLKLLKDMGVKRAVLAREMSIDEIKNINVDIEKEVFVHGALCICYSGECLMSSIVMNRSGNRGECAGMCRLPYKLFQNNTEITNKGKYLLSPKELCTIDELEKILDTNIDSIKIEGRMKSPEYVGFVTKIYRKALDCYYNKKDYIISQEEKENLKKLFNRDFTKGFILNDNENIINSQTPNHQGIEIGKVENINKTKIKIKLSSSLNQGDGIRFMNANKGMCVNYIYDKNNKLINSAKKDDLIYIDNKIDLTINNDIVLKTIDKKLLESINNYNEKKIPVSINIIVKQNQPLKIEFNDGINTVSETGSIVTKSINQSITKDILTEKISKLGNTIYDAKLINISLDDNCFIPIKEINEIRRSLVDKLNTIRINKNTNFIKNSVNFNNKDVNISHKLSILIDNEDDYTKLSNLKNIEFYIDNQELYNKLKNNNNVFFQLPRVEDKQYIFKDERLTISNISNINNYTKNNIVNTNIYCNVTNIYTVKYLTDLGIKRIGLSPELSIEDINNLYDNYIKKFKSIPNLEVLLYGKIELMILKYSLIKDKKELYYLEDRNKEKYKIINKNNNIILNYKPTNKIKELDRIKATNYFISLVGLDIKDKIMIMEFIKGWSKND